MLLYGPPSSGKSLLAVAVAHQAGASLFDLSPAATACKYAGKAAATMVHMVSGEGESWEEQVLACTGWLLAYTGLPQPVARQRAPRSSALLAVHPCAPALRPQPLYTALRAQVFKAARALAPSVVLLEDVDQVNLCIAFSLTGLPGCGRSTG